MTPIVARLSDEELAALQTAKPGGVTYQLRKPNRVYESMTRVRVGPWNVRVWREEASLDPLSRDDIYAAIWSRDFSASDATAAEIVALVETLPRVVAVEVLNDDGNGVLLYPDWN